MTMKHDDPKPMGHSKSSSKREVYSNTISPQETRKISISNNKSNPTHSNNQRKKNKQNPKSVKGKKS